MAGSFFRLIRIAVRRSAVKFVRNHTYFHLNGTWNLSPHLPMKVGDIYRVGSEKNPFFGYYEAHQRTFPVTKAGVLQHVPAIKFLKLVRDGTVKPGNLPGDAFVTAQHFQMLARELVWENIRLAEFSDAPSRQRCLFLCASLPDALSWVNKISGRPINIVRMRATGFALTVDEQNLAGDSEVLPVWYDKARRYFDGTLTANPLKEVLFEGVVTVEKIEQTIP